MEVVDGRCFQVRPDGSVREVGDDVLSPFAAITRFSPDAELKLERCSDLAHLVSQFKRTFKNIVGQTPTDYRRKLGVKRLKQDQAIWTRPRCTASLTAEVLPVTPSLPSRLATWVLTVPSDIKS